MKNTGTPQQFSLFESEADGAASDAAGQPEGKFSNFIVYVDESGDHGMATLDPNYSVFVLSFCIFHKRYYCETVLPALEKFLPGDAL